ncbi:diguanylate cyclase/phosphodiesterase with PAS/PAC sensor [Halorhodospira halochloris]|uniref:histidine kinase n=1 Tax=Halorhodospira halochloris TaxID=1052 RepID=A0A110B763_HALHR|nr:PAS domain-containing protein [Halorhodospira halochloris]MBK1652110.1 hypothetical protein [Halorhodospira halochloris]BAU58033.1 diguanylate cyclase/phosphodiesterase with PAS/PAC sensor [Halorhodospira halochloris]
MHNRNYPGSTENESRELQLQLLNGLAEGVVGIDLSGNFSFLNPAACRMLGFADEHEAIGLHAHSTTHYKRADGSPFPEQECPIYQVQRTGETLQAWDDLFWRQDGSCFPVRVFASPLYGSDNQLHGIVVSFQDLTEKIEQERRYQIAQQAGGVGIWEYYPKQDKIFYDEGTWQLLGYSPHTQNSYFSFATWRDLIHPDDLAQAEPVISSSIATGQQFSLELRYWHAQQYWHWVQARGQAVEFYADNTPKRLMGAHVDIHRLKETEQALRQREQQFTEAKQIARLGNWVSDFVTKRIEWSDEIYDIFGMSQDEWEATHEAFMSAVHPEDRDKVQAALDASIRDGAKYDVEHRVLRPDGSIATVQEIGRTIHDEHGNPLRMVGTVQDITEMRALRDANRAKTQFLNAVSHDLRTPLNAVIGFADILEQTDLDEQQRQYLQLCQSGARRLNELIDTLLDLARLERGNLELSKETFSLHRCVEDLEKLLRLQAEEKNLDLTCTIDPQIPAWVYGDRVRFTQVFQNLVSNAIKFCQAGSVQAAVKQAERESYVTVTVTDSGPGIAAEDHKAIFEAFRQAGNETSRSQGSGLGLSICKELVSLMGGEIDLHSEVGVGSTFTFTVYLPQSQSPTHQATHNKPPRKDTGTASAHVLVADDEPTNTLLLQAMLERRGLRVSIARDGQQALEFWQDYAPDLLIFDLQMPAIGGFQLIAKIREREQALELPRTPAVLCTANSAESIYRESFNCGYDEILTKPISHDSITALLHRVLSLNHTNARQ